MRINVTQSKKITTSSIMIWLLVIWFSANLLSQSMFIGIHGTPYDGIALLHSLGPLYYLVLALEGMLWAWLLIYIIAKAIRHLFSENRDDEIGSMPITRKIDVNV